MKLLYQTHSPYARKALVFAHEAGLADLIEVVHHETSPTQRNEEVFAQNPLGKVPVLLRPGQPAIFVGHIALATALSWLEFRALPGFRQGRPRLTAWFDAFDARASMRATPLSGETRD